MTSTFGFLTIGANPVQISATHIGACKLFVQVAPGATGVVKIGGSSALTMDNTTGGTFLIPGSGSNPGEDWSIEDHVNCNTVNIEQYFFHGTHAGDVLMWQYNQG